MSIIIILMYSIDVFLKGVGEAQLRKKEIKGLGAGLFYRDAYTGRPRGCFLGY